MLKAKEQETQKIKMARHVAPNREEGEGHLVPGIPRKGEADEDPYNVLATHSVIFVPHKVNEETEVTQLLCGRAS